MRPMTSVVAFAFLPIETVVSIKLGKEILPFNTGEWEIEVVAPDFHAYQFNKTVWSICELVNWLSMFPLDHTDCLVIATMPGRGIAACISLNGFNVLISKNQSQVIFYTEE